MTNINRLNKILQYLIGCIPAVGDVELNFSGTNPSTKYPGTTWVQRAQGRALVGVGSNGTNSYPVRNEFGVDKHILSVSEMPAHTHPIHNRGVYATGGKAYAAISWSDTSTTPGDITWAGGNEAHENRQCSIALYVWERTA
ncbi:phage baseplate protein [Hominibacterium faecale]|uniref:phage baseplate protein n=1 Tax=Hominibacterium faecale TaxID=2839743 RepID=UPI0039EA426D